MNITTGEIRYFQWGDEPIGMVSTWTISQTGEIILTGYMELCDVIGKYIFECPFN